MLSWIQNLDWRLLDGIQSLFSCPFLDTVMPIVTRLGDAGTIWILSALELLISKKYRRDGIALLCGLAIGVLIGNIALKNLAARPRPCWEKPYVQMLIAAPKDFSFPSGHTLSSVIAAALLSRIRKGFRLPSILLAMLITFSRLYLYVHFPTDVLASVILGLAIACGVWKAKFQLAITYISGKSNIHRAGCD